jgi:hypothetical protein
MATALLIACDCRAYGVMTFAVGLVVGAWATYQFLSRWWS